MIYSVCGCPPPDLLLAATAGRYYYYYCSITQCHHFDSDGVKDYCRCCHLTKCQLIITLEELIPQRGWPAGYYYIYYTVLKLTNGIQILISSLEQQQQQHWLPKEFTHYYKVYGHYRGSVNYMALTQPNPPPASSSLDLFHLIFHWLCLGRDVTARNLW